MQQAANQVQWCPGLEGVGWTHQAARRHSWQWLGTSSGRSTVTWSAHAPEMASASSAPDMLPDPADLCARAVVSTWSNAGVPATLQDLR